MSDAGTPDFMGFGSDSAKYLNCFIRGLGGALPKFAAAGSRNSTPFSFALDDCDVTVERQLRQSLDRSAGQRPLHFQPVDLRSLARICVTNQGAASVPIRIAHGTRMIQCRRTAFLHESLHANYRILIGWSGVVRSGSSLASLHGNGFAHRHAPDRARNCQRRNAAWNVDRERG